MIYVWWIVGSIAVYILIGCFLAGVSCNSVDDDDCLTVIFFGGLGLVILPFYGVESFGAYCRKIALKIIEKHKVAKQLKEAQEAGLLQENKKLLAEIEKELESKV